MAPPRRDPPRSLWIESTPETKYPELSESRHVDVAVIGAGIVGVTAAYMLKRAGKSVALLDSKRILHGATGYTTAKITAAHGIAYTTIAKKFGKEGSRTYLWRSADRFLPECGKAATWIMTLVHRRAVDLVRREDRLRAEPLGEAADVQLDDSAEEAAWRGFERERVQDALKRLPDQQREALELAYYAGFTQTELAERLGEPLGTIKSRMFNGLNRLRELIERTTQEETRWSTRKSTSYQRPMRSTP